MLSVTWLVKKGLREFITRDNFFLKHFHLPDKGKDESSRKSQEIKWTHFIFRASHLRFSLGHCRPETTLLGERQNPGSSWLPIHPVRGQPGFCILGPGDNTCSQFSGRVSQPLALPASAPFTSSTSPPRPLLSSSVPGLLPPVPSSHSVTFFQSSHLLHVNRFYLHPSISHILICPGFS